MSINDISINQYSSPKTPCQNGGCGQPTVYGGYKSTQTPCDKKKECNTCTSTPAPTPSCNAPACDSTKNMVLIESLKILNGAINSTVPVGMVYQDDNCYKIIKSGDSKISIINKRDGLQSEFEFGFNINSNSNSKYRIFDSLQTIDQTLDITNPNPLLIEAGSNIKLTPINNLLTGAKGFRIDSTVPAGSNNLQIVPNIGLFFDTTGKLSINCTDLKANCNLVSYTAGKFYDKYNNEIAITGGGNGSVYSHTLGYSGNNLVSTVNTTAPSLQLISSTLGNTLELKSDGLYSSAATGGNFDTTKFKLDVFGYDSANGTIFDANSVATGVVKGIGTDLYYNNVKVASDYSAWNELIDYVTIGTDAKGKLYSSPPKGNVIFDIPGSGTWTVPAGVYRINVMCIGGGGAGAVLHGTMPNDGVSLCGGRSGNVAYRTLQVTPGQVMPYIVGDGGSTQMPSSFTFGVYQGTDGLTTTFNGGSVIATGGKAAIYSSTLGDTGIINQSAAGGSVGDKIIPGTDGFGLYSLNYSNSKGGTSPIFGYTSETTYINSAIGGTTKSKLNYMEYDQKAFGAGGATLHIALSSLWDSVFANGFWYAGDGAIVIEY